MLSLLVPGVGMGGGDGGSSTPTAVAVANRRRHGVWQPDVPTVTGPGVGMFGWLRGLSFGW